MEKLKDFGNTVFTTASRELQRARLWTNSHPLVLDYARKTFSQETLVDVPLEQRIEHIVHATSIGEAKQWLTETAIGIMHANNGLPLLRNEQRIVFMKALKAATDNQKFNGGEFGTEYARLMDEEMREGH